MSITVEKKEKNTVLINLSIESQVATEEYNKACKKVSQKVNIPGFRKGKAPRNIIEKHVGTEAIKREAIDALLPSLITQAIRENNLDIVSEPKITSYVFNLGENVNISVEFELRPEVELGEYKNQTIDVEEYKTENNFVEKELEYVRERHASFEPVIGRKTTENDIIVFDFEGTCEGEKIKGGSAKNYNLDLAHSNFIPGFAQQLTGHEISEEFTIDVTFPEDYHDESLKGKPAQFAIKINEIKEKKVPELNDELAKKAGEYNTLDELKADIEKYAKDIEKKENDKRAADAIFAKLLNDVKVELSDTMIERETNAMYEEMKARINSQGGNFDIMVEREGKANIMKEMREESTKRIKNSLIVQKIAALENIDVTSADINDRINAIAAQYKVKKEVVMQQLFSNRQSINALGQQIVSEKVTKFLLDNNNINYKEKSE